MSFWRRKKFESDMDVELGFHIDAYVDDLVRSGIDRSEAERRARLEFGALEATKDECRQAWGLQWMDELRADLRLTFRTLRRNPGFAAVAILSLALGIGANTAIFGLMDAVMLRLLPVPDAGRLMFVRIAGNAAAFAAPVKRELRAVRPAFPINDISTIARQIQQSLRNERLVMALSTAFGTLALLLSCIGLYGVLAYAVTRRTGEIGIRMALGATGSEMIWLILREALALAASGVVIGTPAVWLLGRLARALLFGVGLFDLPAFATALFVLLVFAAIAGIVPARRAGRLDPMSALRCE